MKATFSRVFAREACTDHSADRTEIDVADDVRGANRFAFPRYGKRGGGTWHWRLSQRFRARALPLLRIRSDRKGQRTA